MNGSAGERGTTLGIPLSGLGGTWRACALGDVTRVSVYTLTILALGCGSRTGLHGLERMDAGGPPRADAGPPDAGLTDAGLTDAGPPDAGLTDAGGACGQPADCDDGVECNVDRCVAGECVHEACGVDERCVPGVGCARTVIACNSGGIHEVEIPTGRSRPLFASPVLSCTDIARTTDRRLFVTSFAGLVEVDEGGGPTRAVPLSDEVSVGLNALAGAGPDVLLMAGGPNVYRVDATLGTSERIVRLPAPFVSAGDLVRYDGRWYLSAFVRDAETDFATLFEIDVDARTARRVGEVGFRCVWGLVESGGRLFGLTCFAEILEIDPASGAGRRVGRSSVGVSGAAPR